MTEEQLQESLLNVIENLIDARDEIEGEDDDGSLAELARDLVTETEEVRSVTTFERAQLLTNNAGLVLRMKDGSVFQISIVQSR
ncbi:MAG: hypothetical protein KF768_14050 [Phycisphaeraceae bacterium]|nr:hypothetical protein [Phycisphaeraceae bacterium]